MSRHGSRLNSSVQSKIRDQNANQQQIPNKLKGKFQINSISVHDVTSLCLGKKHALVDLQNDSEGEAGDSRLFPKNIENATKI